MAALLWKSSSSIKICFIEEKLKLFLNNPSGDPFEGAAAEKWVSGRLKTFRRDHAIRLKLNVKLSFFNAGITLDRKHTRVSGLVDCDCSFFYLLSHLTYLSAVSPSWHTSTHTSRETGRETETFPLLKTAKNNYFACLPAERNAPLASIQQPDNCHSVLPLSPSLGWTWC